MVANGWEKLMAAAPAISEIAKNVSTIDLIALTRTSKVTRAGFYDEYFRRVNLRLKLSKDFKDPDALLWAMRTFKVIITGPRAVSMIWEDAVPDWYWHWEFMVTEENLHFFSLHLKWCQGIRWVLGPEDDKARDISYKWHGFANDKIWIYVKVLTSANKHPITQMVGKSSLTVLNCFTSVDATFIGYPEFTLNKLMLNRVSSFKKEYSDKGDYAERFEDKIKFWEDRGFILIPEDVMKQELIGRAAEELHSLYAKNQCTVPIKIMHKPYLTTRQQTEKQLGTLIKIREEKYRYVNSLPQIWVDRTWMKMRPTFKLDPTKSGSKARGQDMSSWMAKAEKARTAKAARVTEVAANVNGEYSESFIEENAQEFQA
ncbi:hypothetical protein ABW21_db0207352 [Orbilia brochopaga]|nr:hypothetical protein ABW21_db0207352 [Drechslerella brochopaga]